MTPSAVIQVKPGIGDVIWHLPFVRAIAAISPGGKVTFLAPPTSHAKELLAAEPSLAATIYFEHAGSEVRRAVNLARLIALLRRHRFGTLWILDRTSRPAFAAMVAGIPQRIGLGLGPQRWFLTNPGIDHSHFHDFPIDWLIALMTAMAVPLPTTEPQLCIPGDVLAAIGQKFAAYRRPWVVLGLGGSHPNKDWPDEHWAEFVARLRRGTAGTVFLIGGANEVMRAGRFAANGTGAHVVNACALAVGEAAALLHLADLYVGPDSGPMNIAAATATTAFALFGATPVLTNSKFIHAITPDGGPAPGGMRRISPVQVFKEVEPYLAVEKRRT